MVTKIMGVSVSVNGTEFEMDNNGPYIFQGEEGLAMPPITRYSQRSPLQHGDSDLGFRLEPRIFSLAFTAASSSKAELMNHRAQLLSWFAPFNNLRFRFDLANGTTRYIDCNYLGGLELSKSDRVGIYQKMVLQFKANDPTFYDVAPQAYTISGGISGDTFEIPHVVPHPVGSASLNALADLWYLGSWYSYPHLIRIGGPVENPVLENLTTNEKLDFTGTTLESDEWLDIDCRFGKKTVKNQDGVNMIAALTTDSDLATFHLEPRGPLTSSGVNTFRFTGSEPGINTVVEINYINRYIGI